MEDDIVVVVAAAESVALEHNQLSRLIGRIVPLRVLAFGVGQKLSLAVLCLANDRYGAIAVVTETRSVLGIGGACALKLIDKRGAVRVGA